MKDIEKKIEESQMATSKKCDEVIARFEDGLNRMKRDVRNNEIDIQERMGDVLKESLGKIEEARIEARDELEAIENNSQRQLDELGKDLVEQKKAINRLSTDAKLLHARERQSSEQLNRKVMNNLARNRRKISNAVSASFERNVVEHLDCHIVDHCNLNCAHCTTFSPIAEKRIVSLEQIEHDLTKLGQVVGDKLLRLHILGGEPLLHPDIIEIMRIARESFPDTRIDITSNGVLVPKMGDDFWEAMKKYDIAMKFTRYPVNIDYDKMIDDIKAKGVFAYSASDDTITSFRRIPLNARGVSSIYNTYIQCPYIDCAQLSDGKLYRCPAAAFSGILNKHLENEGKPERFKLSRYDYLDLDEITDDVEVLDFISNAIPFCQYCEMNKMDESIPWGPSCKNSCEWVDF